MTLYRIRKKRGGGYDRRKKQISKFPIAGGRH